MSKSDKNHVNVKKQKLIMTKKKTRKKEKQNKNKNTHTFYNTKKHFINTTERSRAQFACL